MTFTTAELERIIDNAFGAGEIEDQITEEESKLAKQQILSDHEIVERLKYDIMITEEALKLKPDSVIFKHLLIQLKGTLHGDIYNYPKSILENK